MRGKNFYLGILLILNIGKNGNNSFLVCMCKCRYWYNKPHVTFCRCSLCQGSGLLAKAFSVNFAVNQSLVFCISFCLNRLNPPVNRYLFLKPCLLHLLLKMCPREPSDSSVVCCCCLIKSLLSFRWLHLSAGTLDSPVYCFCTSWKCL